MAETLVVQELIPVHVSKVDRSFAKGGVYFLLHRDEVVYVGQSGSILRRVGEHLSDRQKRFDSVAFISCEPLNRLWLEDLYIKHFQPRYNRPDKAMLKRERKARRRQRHRSRSRKARAEAA